MRRVVLQRSLRVTLLVSFDVMPRINCSLVPYSTRPDPRGRPYGLIGEPIKETWAKVIHCRANTILKTLP